MWIGALLVVGMQSNREEETLAAITYKQSAIRNMETVRIKTANRTMSVTIQKIQGEVG